MRSAHVSTTDVADRVTQPMKIVDMALIKNLRNSNTLARGLEIQDVVGYPKSDMAVSNIGASSSSIRRPSFIAGH